jgi:hypothetical protein
VLVRFNHVARVIVSANHSAMRAAAKLRVVNDVADGGWLTIPQTTEWQRIGNQIDATMIFPQYGAGPRRNGNPDLTRVHQRIAEGALNENKMSYSSSSGDSSAIQCLVFSLNQTLHTI